MERLYRHRLRTYLLHQALCPAISRRPSGCSPPATRQHAKIAISNWTLGALNTTIAIGGFSIKHPVIVYAGNHKEALLGNDIIRGNLTINMSQQLEFKDKSIPPIPIQYRSNAKVAVTVANTILGPRQSALIELTVGTVDRYCAREAVILPNPSVIDKACPIHIINTCSRISSHGETSILAYNPTEDIVYVPRQLKLAQVHFLSDSPSNQHSYQIVDHNFDHDKWIEDIKKWDFPPCVNIHSYGEPEECTNLIHDREEQKALIEDTK
jgi:hypothetical protein